MNNDDDEAEVPPGEPAPGADPKAASQALNPAELVDAWDRIKRELAILLRDTAPDAAWIEALMGTAGRMQSLARRDVDGALYLLLQDAGNGEDRYSAHHALLCALVCDICAGWMDWRPGETVTLVRAALTMNLSIAATQDVLVRQVEPPSAAQREQIDRHAEASAMLLAASGLDDALWIDIVRLHQGGSGVDGADAAAAPPQRLAHLLQRVDIYTAKLSRRANRPAVLPATAARDACLGADGRPDAVGLAILRTLGLYPPGSYVRLANGDIGVVVHRGPQAHRPVVAALRRGDGSLYFSPKRRDTAQNGQAVVHGVAAAEVGVRLHHERNLALA